MNLCDYLAYANLVYGTLSTISVEVVFSCGDCTKTFLLSELMDKEHYNFSGKVVSDNIDMTLTKISIFLEVENVWWEEKD